MPCERVLSLDEKTSLQPRTRTRATRPPKPGLVPAQLEHEGDGEARGAVPVRLLHDDPDLNALPHTPHYDDSPGHEHGHDHHEHGHHGHGHGHGHGHHHPGEGDRHGGSTNAGSLPHEKLDAYRVSLRMAAVAKDVARSIPRGHRNVADHLQRAAQNTVLLLAEGANRRTAGEKRQRFGESRGECGEVAAAADLVLVMELGPRGDAQELKALAGRVSAMLTGLISRLR